MPIKDVLIDTYARIEEISKNKGQIIGLATGFHDFDQKTSGLQPSDLMLVAARPSMGKTSFVLNIAQYAALRNKVPVAIFSLEMAKEQLVQRMLSAEANVELQKNPHRGSYGGRLVEAGQGSRPAFPGAHIY